MGRIGHKMFVNFVNTQFDKPSHSSGKLPRQTTIYDEINVLKEEILEKLKRDTSISKSNHTIEVVKNLDLDEIERLYFHVQNMNYGEYYGQQQDCYGTIDKMGRVELYKSREPQKKYDPDNYKEAFCEYSDDEKRRIEEIKSTIKTRKEEMKTEDKEWSEKTAIQKYILKIQGKKQKQLNELKEFLSKLPIKFEEKDYFKKSLIITQNSQEGEESSKEILKSQEPVLQNNDEEVEL